MKVKVAVFWGCCILGSQYAYEMSVREVLPKLGVELVDLREALCCGDPEKCQRFCRQLSFCESLGVGESNGSA